ncbi:hypothetical protein BGW80DRAFT_1391905 [Lactifluus volemus]|nr:hypothetical protein BGW80DRAFT_1391905 [Lactifluus volemus]
MSVVDSVAILKGRDLTGTEYFKAAVLGWCVEWVCLFALPPYHCIPLTIRSGSNPTSTFPMTWWTGSTTRHSCVPAPPNASRRLLLMSSGLALPPIQGSPQQHAPNPHLNHRSQSPTQGRAQTQSRPLSPSPNAGIGIGICDRVCSVFPGA